MDWEAIAAAAPPASFGRERFRTRVREAVPGGAISAAALADMAQDTAARHAASFAMGFDDALPGGAVWVLARLRLVLRAHPRLGDVVIVETWPAGLDRRSARRAFRFAADRDGVIGAAVSAWSLFSLTERRPLGRIDAIFDAVPPPGPALLDFPAAPKPPATGPVTTITPQPADIDVFGHVNNAHLVAWVLGGLQGRVRAPFQPTELDIAFRRETRLGDALTIHAARTEAWQVRLENGEGVDVLRARVRFDD